MFQLKLLTQDILASTRTDWYQELEAAQDSFSTVGYQHTLDSAELRFSNPSRDQVEAYCLVSTADGKDSAVALLELVHVWPGHQESYMKLMSIRMTPRLDTRMPQTDNDNLFTRHAEISAVASYAMTSVLQETVDRNLKMLKIFTTPQADVNVMMDVVKNTDQEMLRDAGIDVDTHGNWLQFTFASFDILGN